MYIIFSQGNDENNDAEIEEASPDYGVRYQYFRILNVFEKKEEYEKTNTTYIFSILIMNKFLKFQDIEKMIKTTTIRIMQITALMNQMIIAIMTTKNMNLNSHITLIMRKLTIIMMVIIMKFNHSNILTMVNVRIMFNIQVNHQMTGNKNKPKNKTTHKTQQTTEKKEKHKK